MSTFEAFAMATPEQLNKMIHLILVAETLLAEGCTPESVADHLGKPIKAFREDPGFWGESGQVGLGPDPVILTPGLIDERLNRSVFAF